MLGDRYRSRCVRSRPRPDGTAALTGDWTAGIVARSYIVLAELLSRGVMVRLRDIAERAGTSIGTVSLVLNGRGPDVRISERTSDAVLLAAHELGYSPNLAARRLRTHGQSRRPLVLAIAHPVDSRLTLVSRIVAGMQRHIVAVEPELEALGYDVQLTIETFEPGGLRRLRGLREPLWYNGLLVSNTSPDDDAFLEREPPTIPIVAFQRELAISHVNADNVAAGAMVAEHLLGLGHRRFAILTPGVPTQALQRRVQGFNTQLGAAGLPAAEVLAEPGTNWTESAHAAALALLGRPPGDRPSAVFATNDLLALGVIRAARDRELGVPDDLAVVGFDDAEFAPFTVPALTSVHLPIEEMAAAGIAILLDLIQRRATGTVRRRLPTRLVVRESCGAASRAGARPDARRSSDRLPNGPPIPCIVPTTDPHDERGHSR